MKANKIYYIKWFDAQSGDGWVLFSNKDKISNMVIKTIGFFIDENKHYLRLG